MRIRIAIASWVVAACAASTLLHAPVSAQSAGAWKTLFNGKDLTGWTVVAGRGRPAGSGSGGATSSDTAAPAPTPPPPSWKVEDGVLVGGQNPGRGSLVSTDQFKDFELELDFMLAEQGTRCSPDHDGPNAENLDKTCTYNSGISFRTGYQLNLGRREAGEYIGIVVHRTSPQAIRGNVLWLDKGDGDFPNLRKKVDWNHVRITFKGAHLQVWLNGQEICDVMDNPTDPAEAAWKEAGPISLQWPPPGESGGFSGFVKYRNIRIRPL